MLIGYARVSMNDRNIDLQKDALTLAVGGATLRHRVM